MDYPIGSIWGQGRQQPSYIYPSESTRPRPPQYQFEPPEYMFFRDQGQMPMRWQMDPSQVVAEYPTSRKKGIFSDPRLQAALAGAGGGSLGGLAGPWGGAIGGGAAPLIYSLVSPGKESTGQIIPMVLGGALGGGVGRSLGGSGVGGALGGGLGAGLGSYLGYRLGEGGGLGSIF